MQKLRSRWIHGLLLVVTIPLGLGWRMAPLGLSPFWFKYGGSALWAMALYWLIAVCLPQFRVLKVACIAGLVAAGLEFSRLWHVAAVEAFRLTLAGRLLLGRYFSLKNIAAYWIAIALAAGLDRWLVRGRGSVGYD